MFRSRVLNKILIIDLFFSLGRNMLMSSSKLFLFFERSSFKLRCDTVIGIVLCYSHQACCLLYYLADQFTYQSIPKLPIPPGINPGAFDFFEKFWSNCPLCCQFRRSNAPPVRGGGGYLTKFNTGRLNLDSCKKEAPKHIK